MGSFPGGSISGNIKPSNTGQDLGDSTHEWDAYLQDAHITGTLDLDGATLSGSFIGNVTGNVTGNLTGTASSATKVAVGDKGFYNFVTDGLCDNTGITSISTAAQALIDAHPGAHFLFPAGTYKISSTILPKGQGIWIECAKGGVTSGVVHFVVDSGVCAFDFQNANTQRGRFHGGYFTGSEPFTASNSATYILPSDWGGTSAADAIRCSAHGCEFADNLIEKMGRDGIRIDTQAAGGNANNCRVVNNRIINCRGNGIYLVGVDSNACFIANNDCTSNQLWGGFDASFLGNTWVANHTDLNHYTSTTPGATSTITNSERSANVVTLTTSLTHGYAVGDAIQVAGTTSGLFNSIGGIPQFTVLSVPSSTTYAYYKAGADKVSGADTGTSAKYPGASNWVIPIANCSLPSSSTTLTVSSAILGQQYLRNLILIPGAGAAGADLIARINTVATNGLSATLATAGSTTVSNVTCSMLVDGGPYKSVGAAHVQAAWFGNYSEGSQPYSKFGSIYSILGDSGAGSDYREGGYQISVSAGNLRTDASGQIHYRTGNINNPITFVYRPGSTSNQSIIRIFQDFAGTQIFRETVGVNSWATIDVNGKNIFGWVPTATTVYSGGGEVRVGADANTARTAFRSNNVEVASVSSTGLGTFNGGVVIGSAGPQVVTGSASTRNAVRTAFPSVPIGSQYMSTAGKQYIKVANAAADTDWERVTTSAAD